MICQQCQSGNPEGQKYCGQCGAPLEALPAATRAAIEASVRQEVTKALSDHIKDQRMAEFDVTEKVTDRLIGWSKIAGVFLGIFVAGAGYLGFQSFKDVLDGFKKEVKLLQDKAIASVTELDKHKAAIEEQLALMEKQEGPLQRKMTDLADNVSKMEAENQTQISKLQSQVSELDTRFRELPKPTGPAPYHLRLEDVVPGRGAAANAQAGTSLVFQVTGDTGGIQNAEPQLRVANAMAAQLAAPGANQKPAFLYLLGDLIYYNGEKEHYYDQFYEPYAYYPAPIFAIPGNHDGQNLQPDTSLSAFIANFCAPTAVHTPEAKNAVRNAMTQPNSYWSLQTNLATIIGLYTNVPEGGEVHEDQLDWLVHELETAPLDRAVILALHHPPVYFTALRGDDAARANDGMLATLEDAFNRAHRVPNMILSAHVNNYQRIDVELASKVKVPFFVIGTGGYHNLRRLSPSSRGASQGSAPPKASLATLMAGIDDRHGFVTFEVNSGEIKGRFMALSKDGTDSAITTADDFTYSAKPIVPGNDQTIHLRNIAASDRPLSSSQATP
jgi:hypothetical protein